MKFQCPSCKKEYSYKSMSFIQTKSSKCPYCGHLWDMSSDFNQMEKAMDGIKNANSKCSTMVTCDFCSDSILETQMKRVRGVDVISASNKGLKPSKVIRRGSLQQWKIAVTTYSNDEWGLCEQCHEEMKDVLDGKSGPYDGHGLGLSPPQKTSTYQFVEAENAVCGKCGHSEYDYDGSWKEYTCTNCGQILENNEKITILEKARSKKKPE